MFIVDDDMKDITDPYHLFNMMISKFQASKDLTVIPRMQGSVLDPSEPWAGSWGWSDFTIVDLTEPPPPYDIGYKRGVGLPPESAIERGREILKKCGFEEN